MAFDIYEFLNKNKFELGTVKKEVGNAPFKGGNNDIRKTGYDVNIVDGKLDLNTHKTVLVESKESLNEWGGKVNMDAKYENNNDLAADLIKYFKKVEKDIDKGYADEMRFGLITQLKNMKV